MRLSQTGDVAVFGGNGAYGILAQSLGGGGGLIDDLFAGTAGGSGRGGSIDLMINGQVFAPGAGSTAVAAQSLGSLGGGNITINALGAIRGGSGSGAGILLAGGLNNLVTVGTSVSAVSGLAVVGTTGNDTIVNNGLAVGNFRLGGGTNALINAVGGTVITIDTIDLRDGAGSNGIFTNSGTLLLGQSASKYPIDLLAGDKLVASTFGDPATDVMLGTTVISAVALDGDLVMTPTSKSVWDVAFGPYASDRINVTGNAAVNGTADVTLTWLQDKKPVTLISTGGSAIDNGLKVKDTLALDFSIVTAAGAINLAFQSNFGLPFLNSNERALGGSFDSALTVGESAGIGRLLALLGNLSVGQEQTYKAIMAELDPELFVAPQLVQFDAARQFGEGVLGCRESGRAPRKACVWGYAGLNSFDRGTDRGDFHFRQSTANRLRAGVEVPVGADWTIGAALGFDDLGEMRFDGDRAFADGEAIHGGIAVGRSFGAQGAGSARLALTGGVQSTDMTRQQSVFVSSVGNSHYKTDYVGATADIGYSFGTGMVFVRPAVTGSMFRLGQRSFAEEGLGGLGITGVKGHSWIGTVSPGATLGARLSRMATVSVNAGGVFHDRGSVSAPLRLVGANPASDPAIINSRFDKSAWTGGLDLVLGGTGPVSIDLGYQGEFGRSVISHNGRLMLKARF